MEGLGALKFVTVRKIGLTLDGISMNSVYSTEQSDSLLGENMDTREQREMPERRENFSIEWRSILLQLRRSKRSQYLRALFPLRGSKRAILRTSSRHYAVMGFKLPGISGKAVAAFKILLELFNAGILRPELTLVAATSGNFRLCAGYACGITFASIQHQGSYRRGRIDHIKRQNGSSSPVGSNSKNCPRRNDLTLVVRRYSWTAARSLRHQSIYPPPAMFMAKEWVAERYLWITGFQGNLVFVSAVGLHGVGRWRTSVSPSIGWSPSQDRWGGIYVRCGESSWKLNRSRSRGHGFRLPICPICQLPA